jgi:hypothetical protein
VVFWRRIAKDIKKKDRALLITPEGLVFLPGGSVEEEMGRRAKMELQDSISGNLESIVI